MNVGDCFGKLTIIGMSGKSGKNRFWVCQCGCGRRCVVRQDHLRSGATKSCGCWNKTAVKKRMQNNKLSSKHNMAKTRIYRIWQAMKQRCTNSRCGCYRNYGERGIKICQEWEKDFVCFYNWAIKNGYNDNLSIDRIDVNGNYDSKNCRWATVKQQANNTRKNHFIKFNGEKYTLKQFSEKYNIPESTVWNRANRGYFD